MGRLGDGETGRLGDGEMGELKFLESAIPDVTAEIDVGVGDDRVAIEFGYLRH
jgi:hypothetical protein